MVHCHKSGVLTMQANPSVLMFKQYDAPMLKFEGKLTEKAELSEWINSKSLPTLVELDQCVHNRSLPFSFSFKMLFPLLATTIPDKFSTKFHTAILINSATRQHVQLIAGRQRL